MNKLFLSIALIIAFTACVHNKPKTVSTAKEATLTIPGEVIKEKVNMRSRPRTGSSIISTLQEGSEVEIIKNANGWYQVQSADHKQGFIRSDLIGARYMSYANKVTDFQELVQKQYGAHLFIDKSNPYAIIYATFPDQSYQRAATVKKQGQKIAQYYQSQVYPGKIELRILKPHTQELFSRVNRKAIGYAPYSLPILPFGRLVQWQEDHFTIKMWIAVDSLNSQSSLRSLARKIAAHYDLPVKQVDVWFVRPDRTIINSILKHDTQNLPCILHFKEDYYGESFSTCPSGE